MVVLQIEDIKSFMNKLFKENTFDDFEVVSIDIDQGVHIHIDGILNHSFYDSLEQEFIENQKYIKWSALKNTLFSIIKGNKTPSSMKLVFAISEKSKLNLIKNSKTGYQSDDLYGFYLNTLFSPNQLKIVTGTNYKLFSLDKSIEHYYDDSVKKFLKKNEIPFFLMED